MHKEMMRDEILRLFYHLWEEKGKKIAGAKLPVTFYEKISSRDRKIFIEVIEELQREGIVNTYKGYIYEQYGLPDVELTSCGLQYMIAEWR